MRCSGTENLHKEFSNAQISTPARLDAKPPLPTRTPSSLALALHDITGYIPCNK
jgi:hypothetical protein